MMERTIRPLALAEVGLLLDWAANEGWNPGLADAEAFYAVDPEGFIGAFVGDVMCAAIAAVVYNDTFGFIGLYICHPDWRGQGHGKAVWNAGLAHLGQRSIGLDAVPEQRGNYGRTGFVADYETVRMTGRAPDAGTGDVIRLGATDIAAISTVDRQHFPAVRAGFLRGWLSAPNTALALRNVQDITSYGVVRPCQSGHKIGPLFAVTLDDAVKLFTALGAGLGQIQIDVPYSQRAFLDYLDTVDFKQGFLTTRMYRGEKPEFSVDGVFGVTSLELG